MSTMSTPLTISTPPTRAESARVDPGAEYSPPLSPSSLVHELRTPGRYSLPVPCILRLAIMVISLTLFILSLVRGYFAPIPLFSFLSFAWQAALVLVTLAATAGLGTVELRISDDNGSSRKLKSAPLIAAVVDMALFIGVCVAVATGERGGWRRSTTDVLVTGIITTVLLGLNMVLQPVPQFRNLTIALAMEDEYAYRIHLPVPNKAMSRKKDPISIIA